MNNNMSGFNNFDKFNPNMNNNMAMFNPNMNNNMAMFNPNMNNNMAMFNPNMNNNFDTFNPMNMNNNFDTFNPMNMNNNMGIFNPMNMNNNMGMFNPMNMKNNMGMFNPMNMHNNFVIEKNNNLENSNPMINNMIKRIFINNNENNVSNFQEYKVFISKDIQIKNSEITREIQSFSKKYIKDDDPKENESVGKLLMNIAIISRKSFLDSFKIISLLAQKYNLIKNEFKGKEFKKSDLAINISSILKTIEYNIEKNIKNIISLYSNIEEKNFFKKLYKDLFNLYFQCKLSVPPIEINFNLNNDSFIKDDMIDFLSVGGEKKVNFVFLPSLCSNGNYLENGRQWVFTYKADKKTFFYEKNELCEFEQLNNFINQRAVSFNYI